MKHYDFAPRLQELVAKANDLYAKGQRDAATYFTPDEMRWLAANGITDQHLYDYGEDFVNHDGEPGVANAIAIESVRRDYFINVQRGRPSGIVLEEAKLPAKTDAIQGIEWLPRIIPKTKAKLRGELPRSLMYCCGGDRRFFRTHDIAPAEFLSLVWRHEDDNAAIIAWVVARSRGR